MPFPRRFYLYLFLGILFPFTQALIGALFYDTNSVTAGKIAMTIFLFQLLLTLSGVVVEKNRRLFTFSTGYFFLIWSVFTGFVAGMAISNTWL